MECDLPFDMDINIYPCKVFHLLHLLCIVSYHNVTDTISNTITMSSIVPAGTLAHLMKSFASSFMLLLFCNAYKKEHQVIHYFSVFLNRFSNLEYTEIYTSTDMYNTSYIQDVFLTLRYVV